MKLTKRIRESKIFQQAKKIAILHKFFPDTFSKGNKREAIVMGDGICVAEGYKCNRCGVLQSLQYGCQVCKFHDLSSNNE